MLGAGICMVRIGATTLTACWLLWPSKQQVLCMTFNIAAVSVVAVADHAYANQILLSVDQQPEWA